MRQAARLSFPQVKQWANSAVATGAGRGSSSKAAGLYPREFAKSMRLIGSAPPVDRPLF
jgi:hypothetical protein